MAVLALATIQQYFRIIDDRCRPDININISAMVNDKVLVIWIGVVLKTGQIYTGVVSMVVLYRPGHTGIQQFNATQISDIGFYHQRIHSLDAGIDPHHFGDLFTQILDTAMKQIHTMGPLIFIATRRKRDKVLSLKGCSSKLVVRSAY